jgi:hypothetical protein
MRRFRLFARVSAVLLSILVMLALSVSVAFAQSPRIS